MYIVLYLRLLDLYYDCKAVNGGRRVLRFLDHYSIFCYNSLLIHPVVSTHFCTYVINLPTSYTPMLKRTFFVQINIQQKLCMQLNESTIYVGYKTKDHFDTQAYIFFKIPHCIGQKRYATPETIRRTNSSNISKRAINKLHFQKGAIHELFENFLG